MRQIKRESNFELLRIISMLMIVSHHLVNQIVSIVFRKFNFCRSAAVS